MHLDGNLMLANLASDSLRKILGVVEAVGGFLAALALLFFLAERVRGRLQRPVAILVCLAPAALLLLIGLIVPAIRTVYLSLHGQYAQGPNVKYVGLANYKWAFTDGYTQSTLIRTVLWLVIVPAAATLLGLLFALAVDRVRYQSLPKSLIFMPTAISFVGASVIWKYVYAYSQPGTKQIGLLSEVVMKLGWSHPPNWLLSIPLNTFLLMIIMVWIETGFAMVVLRAALKAIPDEVLEAARMDGASGYRLFASVQVPMIRTTLIVVVTTIMIATLKVFDIVYTMTGGNFKTDVLSDEMYTQIFSQFNYGRGSALAVVLFASVTPLVAYSVIRLRKERALR